MGGEDDQHLPSDGSDGLFRPVETKSDPVGLSVDLDADALAG